MNKLIIALLLISVNAMALEERARITRDVTYTCLPTNEDRKFDDIFIIDVKVNGPDTMSYQRRTTEGLGEKTLVPRCGDMTQVWMDHMPEALVFECEDSGEQGFFAIRLPAMDYAEVAFYMPKLGYEEREGFDLSCTAEYH